MLIGRWGKSVDIPSVHEMNPVFTVIVSVALIATSHALPLGSGLGTGVGLIPAAGLNGKYNTALTIGGRPVNIGLSWEKDGTIAAGALIDAVIGDDNTPIAGAISTNLNNIGSDLKIEVGARILDAITAAVTSDGGDIKYLVNGWFPVRNQWGNSVSGVGVGIEGERLKPVAVSAEVGVGAGTVGARVGLNSNYMPENANVIIEA